MAFAFFDRKGLHRVSLKVIPFGLLQTPVLTNLHLRSSDFPYYSENKGLSKVSQQEKPALLKANSYPNFQCEELLRVGAFCNRAQAVFVIGDGRKET